MSKSEPNPAAPTPAWHALGTEARHRASADLDRLDSAQAVALLLAEDGRGIAAAAARTTAIAALADRMAETLLGGGDTLFVGAGTSGRLGVLEAAECPPTFGTDPRRMRAFIAGGAEAVFRAREGAEDDAEAGLEDLAEARDVDLVVGLSASGVTRYVLGALAAARRAGAATALVTCATAEDAAGHADLVVALATGPEVLTGSTRLKAGSATKAALNAATTAAMIRLGKVFENLMVDLRPGSAKLRDRARRIIATAGRVTPQVAERLLDHAGGNVKVAIVMARRGLDADAAQRRLDSVQGHVRQALTD